MTQSQEGLPTEAEDNKDIFSDPSIARAANDPVTQWFLSNWRPVVTAIVSVLATLYVIHAFRENRRLALEEGGDAFARVRTQYDELVESNGQLAAAKKTFAQAEKDKKEEDKKKAEEEVKAAEKRLGETRTRLTEHLAALSDHGEPYLMLASLYRGLIAATDKDIEGLKSNLKPLSEKRSSKDETEQFYGELASLALARGLLDRPESSGEAKALLKSLARDGKTVYVSAAVSLATIAESDEEKKEAREILVLVKSTHSGQDKALDDALRRVEN